MSVVAILGAGDLGGALAHTLAGHARVADIRLIDTARGIASGKALDISQAGPVECFDTCVTAAGQLDAVIGAAAVVLTGPADAAAEEWQGDAALGVLDQVARLAPRAPIVCAGASQGEVVERAVMELGIDPRQILGTAPAALVSGLRALIALTADTSPAAVSVNLLGAPPVHPVVAWSGASIEGYPLEDRLTPAQVARLQRQLRQLWPPGPYALSSAAVQVINALVTGGSRRRFACFVVDQRRRTAGAQSLGVTVDLHGVDTVDTPRLNRLEQTRLENALTRRA